MGRPKAPLTDRDFETLGEIISAVDQRAKYSSHPETIGVKPLDFGGSNGSHHSLTASKLVRHGMAEHRKRGRNWGEASLYYRGSKHYRPTDEGRAAYAAWAEAKRATS
jgi:hypothetical protein